MRVITVEKFGTEPQTVVPGEAVRPEPGLGEVLIEVHATSVNPVDAKKRSGDLGDLVGAAPYVPGWDVSGVVVASGPGARWEPGDEVFGMPLFPVPANTFAEFALAPSYQVARKPGTVDHATAAGLPLAGLTALQALDLAGVGTGTRVLVHASAGGVGHLAVQLAAARGAHVIGTARQVNHEFVRGLGAAEVVDYTAAPFETQVSDVDVVLDLIGDEYSHRSLGVLRPGGVVYRLVGPVDDELRAAAAARGVRAATHLVHPDGPGLSRLAELVDGGQLRLAVAGRLPVERAAEAFALSDTGRTRGKLVLTVSG
ncbi:NADP-dependent oxidoreductase [Longispora albida]|uniref:NADP-dependent oxidoreductase n=1 Tax=Longispora albida TaxID=203523 RepID=UPI000590F758|nr:NADP-dependent oxidoreductase [Longispora albida]